MSNIEGLVEKYIAARDKKQAIMNEAKERCAKIDGVLDKIEGILLAAFDETGLESVKTASGTAYKQTRNAYSVADWDNVLAFIRENEMWHMLERRVAKSAVDAYREETDALPPGLDARSEVVINIRRSK